MAVKNRKKETKKPFPKQKRYQFACKTQKCVAEVSGYVISQRLCLFMMAICLTFLYRCLFTGSRCVTSVSNCLIIDDKCDTYVSKARSKTHKCGIEAAK